jgi:hypothetical protein
MIADETAVPEEPDHEMSYEEPEEEQTVDEEADFVTEDI